jgi:hypothetical protein
MHLSPLRFTSAAVLACVVTAVAFAADPTGTWSWKQTMRNGESHPITLKLDLKGAALTGTISGRYGDTPISQGSVQGDRIAFEIVRTFNDNTFTIKYSGKIQGDTITGKIELPGFDGGTPRMIDWKATRGAPAAAPADQ